MNDAKMPDPTHMHVSLSPEAAREIREALTDAVDDLAAAIEFEHNPRMRENYAAIEEAYRRAMTVVTRARAALDVMNNEVPPGDLRVGYRGRPMTRLLIDGSPMAVVPATPDPDMLPPS